MAGNVAEGHERDRIRFYGNLLIPLFFLLILLLVLVLLVLFLVAVSAEHARPEAALLRRRLDTGVCRRRVGMHRRKRRRRVRASGARLCRGQSHLLSMHGLTRITSAK